MTVNPSRIRQARLAAGLSQDDLARRAVTSARNIARWEKGNHTPRLESVAAIAAATGRDVAYFLSEDGNADGEDEEVADPVTDLVAAVQRFARSVQPKAAT